MVEDVELDQEALRNWLEVMGERVVGRPCHSWFCPLASWLGVVYGGQWAVSTSSYHTADLEVWEELPTWARAFVLEVDWRYDGCEVVTGEMALAALVEAVS